MKKSSAYWEGYSSILVKIAGLPGGGTLSDWESLLSEAAGETPTDIHNPWQRYLDSDPTFGGSNAAELTDDWTKNQALAMMYKDVTLARRNRMREDPKVQAILQQGAQFRAQNPDM